MWVSEVIVLSLALLGRVDATPLQNNLHCKCTAKDACWPAIADWASFNKTLDGKLIATVPLGSPCHDPSYNGKECSTLADEWEFATIHANNPSSIMMPVFQNGTCDPFHPQSDPCQLGNLVQYSVNATTTAHVQEAVRFAARNNLRLVIKNTGHDFLGRSTSAGALGLWTHNLDEITVLKDFSSPDYNGPAMRIGAGVQAAAAYTAAHEHGYRAMGGSCPTVGLAGGFTQGGGLGALSSIHGLGADNVLEWEVVTANGSLVHASPNKNADLFWALAGGAGGTFGVVVSMTSKVFVDAPTTGASLVFELDAAPSADAFWDSISVFHAGATPLVDTGSFLLSQITNTTFQVIITAPSVTVSTLNTQLSYITGHLNNTGIAYSLTAQTDASYFDFFSRYFGPLPDGIYPVAHLVGSRLLPRDFFQSVDRTKGLQDLLRSITPNQTYTIAVELFNVNQTSVADRSVHPAWRDSIAHFLVYSTWDWSSSTEMAARSDRLTNEIIPTVEELTPGSGTYRNEANYRQKDWQKAFFGDHWDRLNSIQRTWDPKGVFYAPLSVGADQWAEKNGALCRVS
ncbi:FAD-binding, type 2 [Penicillium griseofulvum]|uniref:FAD-binding, type 2 n=1 Tax=Penicillium patulum TaxID=5078 RepID=A0A135LN70_PENPA|nr:FAD-binding, type 2 [Penicillium griseofulvum]KXG50411.1 FAD-binding, type 2 [Penicillium griseofulvum]